MWHLNILATLIANMSLFQDILFTRGDSFNYHLHQLILKKQIKIITCENQTCIFWFCHWEPSINSRSVGLKLLIYLRLPRFQDVITSVYHRKKVNLINVFSKRFKTFMSNLVLNQLAIKYSEITEQKIV